MNKLNRLVGSIAVLIFLFTGFYMRTKFPGLYEDNESIRFMFRANHIYILLSGLLNITIGTYLIAASQNWKRKLQFAGSFLVLIAPVLLILAFFLEPQTASPERPLTSYGIFALALGTVCQVPNWFSKQ